MSQLTHPCAKPHLNIGTMGHVDHGKTTLTAAITKVLSEHGAGTPFVPAERIDRAPEEVARGITIHPALVEYETETRHYAHADLPGHARFVKNMITGAAQLDGAILVVSAVEGVRPQTAEHVLLARQGGVDHIVVALSKAESGPQELADRVERDVRALLSAHGYPGDTTPVLRVSGMRALAGDPRWTDAVQALLDAVDIYVPTPQRCFHSPFLLPVRSVRSVTGRGTVVTGTVERGTVRAGDRVELLGTRAGRAPDPVVGEVRTFGRPLPYAGAGDSVALLLRGVDRDAVRRGHVLAAPGSVVPRRRFTARVTVLSAAAGGRHTPLATGYRPQCHLRTADVTGTVDLGPGGTARPGETVTMTLGLDRGLPLEPGLGFALREGGRTVGAGSVITVAD
ncbi:elongation factor Tu [Streptomyces sp. NPDC018031]|uniref:elongation factor Tu n=1 Tax=Streptomyces sp. NPDC018031 TaxID=3365033 RepID=UPI0037ADFE57